MEDFFNSFNMKKLIKLLLLLLVISCGNPYDKFQEKEVKVEQNQEKDFNLLWILIPTIGLIITVYGKHHKLNRYRTEMYKYHHIPTDPPRDGRLEIDLHSSSEKATSEEIITEINDEEAEGGGKNFLWWKFGRHETRRKTKRRKK